MVWPENEKDLVGAAAEHIEEASIADGFENEKKPEIDPESGLPQELETEAEFVGAAAEHIADAAVANGQVER